jgi:ABC-type antimicrobial peptide transport system permease subunit
MRMMATEGVALVGVGTAVGAGLGWLLAQITLPLLAVTLSASMGGSTEAPLLPDWLALGQLLLVMLALYLLAVLAVAWLNGRVEIARLLRWGM